MRLDPISELTRTVRNLLTRAPEWPGSTGGAYLGMGARNPVFTGSEHAALVIGPPRSGKTSSIIIPAISYWTGPVVTTSTKPDVLHTTYRARARQGQTWVWDPTGRLQLPAGATRLAWSPITGCADWDSAIDRAWVLVHSARPDPNGDALHWTERASALLAPLLHAAALGQKDMATMLRWIHRRETPEAVDILDTHNADVAQDMLTGIDKTDDREKSGIWSTADSVLAAYRSSAALAATTSPNFDPARFVTGFDTVHLVAPAHRAAQHAPVICALLDQIRHHAIGCTGRTQMLWALDEMANIAPLPNLPAVVADSGSQGLLVLAAIQDLSQARHRWGQQADGFLTLFTTTVLLPGVADPETLRTVTTLAGEVDRPHYSRSRGWGLKSWSSSTTTRRLPLLPESLIAHGKPGHALHLRATNPSWLRLTPWHTTPWLAHQLRGAA